MNKITKTVLAAVLLAGALAANAAEAKQAKAVKPYPMDTCVVSGEKLGGMGEPVSFEYEGREIMLCCKDCRKEFDKNPKKFVAKVDEAAKQVKPYPLKTCLMSGEPLPENAPALVYQKQEVKFCCKDCKKSFAKDPAKNAAKLPKAKS